MTTIAIAGGPRTGKTTLAAKLGSLHNVPVRHTDDLIDTPGGWSAASEAASRWLSDPGPWIVEGVAVPRAIRKWLEANRHGKPADTVYWLAEAMVDRSPGQIAMARGCATVWREIVGQLERRGVELVTLDTTFGRCAERVA